MTPRRLAAFFEDHGDVVDVHVRHVKGSGPREVGARILVGESGQLGTIGGGQLEYMAIDEARRLLKSGAKIGEMDVPLGPDIGQCCGGRVWLDLRVLSPADKATLVAGAEERHRKLPAVYILGSGHVGRALALQLQTLPLRTILIDSRAGELALNTADVDTRLTALPEAEIRNAETGSAFVMMTHEHSLDFLLVEEALDRGDAAYVGMIGSASKAAQAVAHLRRNNKSSEGLTSPIAANAPKDKRPEVIAAFLVAELLTALHCHMVNKETNA